MRLRSVKARSLAQTDLMLVHHFRERLVSERMRLVNLLRGYLKEHGIVLPARDASRRRALPALIGDAPISARALIARRGKHLAASAVANKLARIIWACCLTSVPSRLSIAQPGIQAWTPNHERIRE
jgi:hypothetical protein